jgi:hypothetical protein
MKRVWQLLPLGAVAVCLLFVGVGRLSAAPAASGPCGTATVASVHYTHVLWIWEENHSYNQIIGSSNAPYINTLASQCGVATNYHNVTHPSLPNYLAATSGLALSALPTNDCRPAKCSTTVPSIFGETSSWKAYEESMPSNCDTSNADPYYVKHNPPPYYSTLANCRANDVPYTQLAKDLSSGSLPAFSFVTPNSVDDMHSSSINAGDAWLAKTMPTILNSSAYKTGTLAVFITWDEGSGGTAGESCATNTKDNSCHVATLVISPSTVAGTKSSALFNHYSLQMTTASLLHLTPLGLAASSPNMMSAFNL